MERDFNPNRKVSTVYICPRSGQGISVEVDKDPNYIQDAVAMAMVQDCEEAGGCPPDCPIRMIAERRM